MITEALRRRRVEADESDRFVARLFGLELGQATYDAGAAFVDGVVERGRRRTASTRSGRANASCPTPAEIAAPGLWLARIDLPDEPIRPTDRPATADSSASGRRCSCVERAGVDVDDGQRVVIGARRRSVGDPGLSRRWPSSPSAARAGAWLWPKITRSASGNHRCIRRSRPLVGPLSWTIADVDAVDLVLDPVGQQAEQLVVVVAEHGGDRREAPSSSSSSGTRTSPACQMASAPSRWR